jgi:hypothetical protein
MKLFAIPEWFIWLSFAVTFLAAMWKGSWQARVIVGSQLAQILFLRAWVLVTGHTVGGEHNDRMWVYLAQDLVLLAITLACALTTRRYWVLWVASIGLAATATDSLTLYTHVITVWASKWAGYIWTFATLILVLGDVWANVRNRPMGWSSAPA